MVDKEEVEQKALGLLKDVQQLFTDLTYLRKPSLMTKSYEEALVEIKRRQHFRNGLD